MTEKLRNIEIAIRKWLGSWFGGYCTDCGSELVIDEVALSGGYRNYTSCPHCDNLDRFDIPSDYRSKEVIETAVKELKEQAANYIRCVDCGVGIGTTMEDKWKDMRRRFVKAHWGHEKEEL